MNTTRFDGERQRRNDAEEEAEGRKDGECDNHTNSIVSQNEHCDDEEEPVVTGGSSSGNGRALRKCGSGSDNAGRRAGSSAVDDSGHDRPVDGEATQQQVLATNEGSLRRKIVSIGSGDGSTTPRHAKCFFTRGGILF